MRRKQILLFENAHTQNPFFEDLTPFLGSIYIATLIFTQNIITSVKIEFSLRLSPHSWTYVSLSLLNSYNVVQPHCAGKFLSYFFRYFVIIWRKHKCMSQKDKVKTFIWLLGTLQLFNCYACYEQKLMNNRVLFGYPDLFLVFTCVLWIQSLDF